MTPVDMDKAKTGDLLRTLRERGYFVSRVPKTNSGGVFKADLKPLAGNKYRFGVVSCTQIGSKHQQMTHLHSFYSLCRRRKIGMVLHCGDMVEGTRVYRGQEYELFLHGADAQVEYTVDNYPKMSGIETKAILGNHDESFWKNGGFNVVDAICRERSDMEYIGDYLAYVNMGNIKLGVMHAAGGVPYARSYKVQKIIEQLSPESKPHMLFIGHWHVQCHIPAYRNVEGFSVGCFQSQTPFLTRLGLSPDIGGLIVEVKANSSGIASVKTEWIPFYKPKKNDF